MAGPQIDVGSHRQHCNGHGTQEQFAFATAGGGGYGRGGGLFGVLLLIGCDGLRPERVRVICWVASGRRRCLPVSPVCRAICPCGARKGRRRFGRKLRNEPAQLRVDCGHFVRNTAQRTQHCLHVGYMHMHMHMHIEQC